MKRRAMGRTAAAKQRGAVLYIALIMLVLLTLLGLVAMQVAGMQERMAANYYSVQRAFQNAEALLRKAECNIEDTENHASLRCEHVLSSVAISYNCDDGFDPGSWLSQRGLAGGPALNVRKIDQCVAGESTIAMGVGPLGEASPISTYQITGYDTDAGEADASPTSAAAIDTVFRL